MSWEQILEWMAYDQVEPFGEERADLRAGIVASSVTNTLRQVNSTKRLSRSQLSKPSDFMLFARARDGARPTPKPMTAGEFRSAFDGFKEMVKATAGT